MTSISYENIYIKNENNNENAIFVNENAIFINENNNNYISNNHIHFLLHLHDKKRYIGNITYKILYNCKMFDLPYEDINTLHINTDYNKFTEIFITKKYIYYFKEISFYFWQLTILIQYFLSNNIEFSFSNLCIYKEYLDGGGYSIDFKISNGENIYHKKKNNYYLNKLTKKSIY